MQLTLMLSTLPAGVRSLPSLDVKLEEFDLLVKLVLLEPPPPAPPSKVGAATGASSKNLEKSLEVSQDGLPELWFPVTTTLP